MAILHYFEVVQWHSDPTHQPLTSCHPPALWNCLCSVSWVPGGTVSDHVEAELLSSCTKLIQGQRSRLEVTLDEVMYSDCFPLAELLKLTRRCAWFYLTGCFCLFKSSAPHCLENMHMMWMCLAFLPSGHQTVVGSVMDQMPPWARHEFKQDQFCLSKWAIFNIKHHLQEFPSVCCSITNWPCFHTRARSLKLQYNKIKNIPHLII